VDEREREKVCVCVYVRHVVSKLKKVRVSKRKIELKNEKDRDKEILKVSEIYNQELREEREIRVKTTDEEFYICREREKERKREREKERKREREKMRNKGRERERKGENERERQRKREKERENEKERD
jgi:hypothetical protein